MDQEDEARAGRERRVEEAVAWYYQQAEAGRPLDPAAFLGRYPDLAPDLESFLTDKAEFDLAAGPPSGRPVDPDATVGLPGTPGSGGAPIGVGAIGDYEILEEVARGGMGVVYKARQVSLNRVVALKMILAGELASDADVRRFRAEAEAAAHLDHPNILPIYEVGEHQGRPYFAMKFVAGGSLAGRVGDLVKDAGAAAGLVRTLARAVDFAHRRGVLHRDLKPANILIDADGVAYLTDFGLAKRTGVDDGLTKTGAALGTPSYMAPEQARGEKGLSPSVDVYALGVVLYELLTGRPPFHGPTPFDAILGVLEREPPHPRAVARSADPDLSHVALKCLEKDPARRYPTAAALADDLDRWLAGEAVAARRRRGLRAVLAWARREPGLACRFAVLGLCAAVVHLRYQFDPTVSATWHAQTMAILAAWAAVSVGCQWLLRRDWHPDAVVAAWLAAEVGFLTGLLVLVDSAETPLVVSYGLFVAASGVWLQVRFVWFSTAMAVVGYTALVGQAAARGGLAQPAHRHVIAVIVLVVLGAVVAYQVRRARLLSRYRASSGSDVPRPS